MQLTTPEAKEYDAVFPGENWFFYWRTSPSLWESKLSEYRGPSPIFAPVFWGLHNEAPGLWDFGDNRPETDLKKLNEVALGLGKEIVFLVSISPAPYLPNGGLPSHLARTMLVGREGLALACLDSDDRLNKLFSFFDPSVFQEFVKFTTKLGRYFSENAIAREVYGMRAWSARGNRKISFFEDHSLAFERGFSRYLGQLRSRGELPEAAREEELALSELKQNYTEQIQSLYEQAASESLSPNWSGALNFGFLGASADDIFSRSHGQWEGSEDYYQNLLNMLTLDLSPNSSVLSPGLKREPLAKLLSDVVNESFIRLRLDNDLYDEEGKSGFSPLYFFELAGGQKSLEVWDRSGLLACLNRQFPWAYRVVDQVDASIDDDWETKIRFFQGRELGGDSFNQVLKLLLSGSRVFVDLAGLDRELSRRLQTFIVENDLKVEQLNYISPISKISLGEGAIITYNSEKLIEAPMVKKLSFWDTLLSYLKIQKLSVEADEGIHFFWASRASNTYELNYDEVRRVSLYNSTSYKKKARIVFAKKFAFLKTVDQRNAEVRSTPIGVDALLLPGGSVSLDFGHYE